MAFDSEKPLTGLFVVVIYFATSLFFVISTWSLFYVADHVPAVARWVQAGAVGFVVLFVFLGVVSREQASDGLLPLLLGVIVWVPRVSCRSIAAWYFSVLVHLVLAVLFVAFGRGAVLSYVVECESGFTVQSLGVKVPCGKQQFAWLPLGTKYDLQEAARCDYGILGESVGVVCSGEQMRCRCLGEASSGPIAEEGGFSIESVLIMIRVERVGSQDVMYVRTAWFANHQPGVDVALDKRYTKGYADNMSHWSGTQDEHVVSSSRNHITSKSLFRSAGGSGALLFGANVEYQLPLENSKSRTIRGNEVLGEGEHWWGYPNNRPGSIEQVTIAVESSSLRLSIPPGGALRLDPEGRILSENNARTPRAVALPDSGSVVAQWNEVSEGQLVALRFLAENL